MPGKSPSAPPQGIMVMQVPFNLGVNEIDDKGIRVLSSASWALEEMDIGWNNIKDDVAGYLAVSPFLLSVLWMCTG